MLIVHAKELLDRRIAEVWASWHEDESLTVKGKVLEIQTSDLGYRLVIDGLASDSNPLYAPLKALHDYDIMIPHSNDAAVTSSLVLFNDQGDPIELLEAHGVDLHSINLHAVRRAYPTTKHLDNSQENAHG